MARNNSKIADEVQIRQLIDSWAGAIRNKNIEAAVSHYARDILLYDLAPPLGRGGGRPTVEQALRLDIDDMMRWGRIRAGSHLAGEMRFNFYDDQIDLKFESRVGDPWDSWLRLRYSMTDYCSGEELKIDDKVYLAPTRPHFGGLRWWFVCPQLNRRVRKLYLPLGSRHFWSRRAYELAYASQRETKFDRALRRARKLCLRLGGDPADDEYPTSRRGCAGRRTIGSWTDLSRLMALRMNGSSSRHGC